MNTVITLLKREYWENRGSFAITPVAIGGFFVLVMLLALFNTEHITSTHGFGSISINGISVSGMDFLGNMTIEFANLPLEKRENIWELGFYGISSSFTLVMILVSFIYLLGSLYDDRKDRSILFWKSLPVSDLLTVMSKVLTVIFVIPALFAVAATATYLAIMIIASIVALFSGGSIWASIWEPAPFLTAPLKLYFTYIVQSLWAAPFLAWLLLVSSWTKYKPILMATIPLAAVSFLEFYFYRTQIFSEAVRDRAFGWAVPVDFSTGQHLGTGDYIMNQGAIYDSAYSLLELSEFWYGLIVAALMVAGAVYIRRFRDES
ncbi:MAG: hypothetical protein DRQ47_00450 [Gammaproteobacteria bacterium]|nr:MAG: hypothetical protein DRQ47_00450 [Gammaproteobacteria bacterium]